MLRLPTLADARRQLDDHKEEHAAEHARALRYVVDSTPTVVLEAIDGDWQVVVTTGEYTGLTYSLSVQVDALGRVFGSGVLPQQTCGSRTYSVEYIYIIKSPFST